MLRALLLALALLASRPAWADGLALAPSPAQRCLTPGAAERGTPEYPAEEWKLGAAGLVQVEVIFTTTDRRPEVKILDSAGGPAFVDAVKDHVRQWRLPCLEFADIPARLRIEFVFRPTQRSATTAGATDPESAERQRQLKCVLNTAGRIPSYPRQARSNGIQGRVLVQMRFTSGDGPPEVTVVARPSSDLFAAPAQAWAKGFRLPCYGGRPLSTEWLLLYKLEGEGDYGFRGLSLKQFVGAMRGIRHQRVVFDLTTMGCPFALRLQYLQPHLQNRIRQVDEPLAARQPFLDWLESAQLDLKETQLDAIFGDTLLLEVPCIRINLNPELPLPPQEKP